MKVNKNSRSYKRFDWWFRHLRAEHRLRFGGGNQRNDYGWSKEVDDYTISLCSYFWAANLKYWFKRYGDVIFGVFISLWVLAVMVFAFASLYVEYGWVGPLGFVGFVVLVMGAIAGFILLSDYRDRRKFEQPSEIGSYIKAKKSKVCPILEFEDGV